MPQKRPEYLPGQYYHFYNRGAYRTSLFKEPENFLYALRKVKKYLAELQLTMIVCCLMPNHYHFVTQQLGEQATGSLPLAALVSLLSTAPQGKHRFSNHLLDFK